MNSVPDCATIKPEITSPHGLSAGSQALRIEQQGEVEERSVIISNLTIDLKHARTEAKENLDTSQRIWEEACRIDAEYQQWAGIAQKENAWLEDKVKHLKQKLNSATTKLVPQKALRVVEGQLRGARNEFLALEEKFAQLDKQNQRLHMVAGAFVAEQNRCSRLCAEHTKGLSRREKEVAELRQCVRNQAINLREQEIVLQKQMSEQLQRQILAQTQPPQVKYPTSAMREDQMRLKDQILSLSK